MVITKTDIACCVTAGEPWEVKRHHYLSEVKGNHQLNTKCIILLELRRPLKSCKIFLRVKRLTQRLYLDDLINIDNPYFEGLVNQTYPPELQ